jgi:hypothetical protein
MSGRPLARCADRAAYGESTAPRPVRLPIPPSCPIAVGRDRGIFGGARPPTLTFSSVAADLNDHGDTMRLGPACRSMRAQVERPASAPRRELRRFRWPRSRRFAPPALRGVQISPRPLLQCTSPLVAKADIGRDARGCLLSGSKRTLRASCPAQIFSAVPEATLRRAQLLRARSHRQRGAASHADWHTDARASSLWRLTSPRYR